MLTRTVIRPFDAARDQVAVVSLWRIIFGYGAPHNDPEFIIRMKLAVDDGLFSVAECGGEMIGTVMAGYDGHRGWIYSLAVQPAARGKGTGSQLLQHAEAALAARGCVKVNLQVLADNNGVVDFYRQAGYTVEPRISMGKLISR